jgi:hypothetical protein
VLPPVIPEGELFPFRFWLNGSFHNGMHYRSELFYLLYTADAQYRSQVYHYACKLAQNNTIVISMTEASCRIWVSLRSPQAIASILQKHPIPKYLSSEEDSSEQGKAKC